MGLNPTVVNAEGSGVSSHSGSLTNTAEEYGEEERAMVFQFYT